MQPVGAMLLSVAVFSPPRCTYLQSKYNKRSHPLAACALISCSAVDMLHTWLSVQSSHDLFFISDFFSSFISESHMRHTLIIISSQLNFFLCICDDSSPINPQSKAGACALFCQRVVVIVLIYLFSELKCLVFYGSLRSQLIMFAVPALQLFARFGSDFPGFSNLWGK